MVERLEFAAIVRYLLSSIAASVAVCIAIGIGPREIVDWITKNSWAREVGPVTSLLLVLLFAGYLSFMIYRGLVYEFVLLPFKDWVGKELGAKSYRTYLSDISTDLGGPTLSGIQAERVYALVKLEDFKEFYKGSGDQITTGIHFLLYCGIVGLIGTLFRLMTLWRCTIVCVVAIAAVFMVDWHFEQLELLLFRSHEDEVRNRVRTLVPKARAEVRSSSKGSARD